MTISLIFWRVQLSSERESNLQGSDSSKYHARDGSSALSFPDFFQISNLQFHICAKALGGIAAWRVVEIQLRAGEAQC